MKRILIIRFSSIGDIVLSTPVVEAIKTQLKDVEIHYLTKKQYAPLLSSNPDIDKLIVLDTSLKQVNKILKSYRYDFVVDLHHNLRSFIIKQTLKKPHATFSKLNFKKWLYVNFKINRLPRIHLIDRYFQAVRALGVRNEQRSAKYVIPDDTFIPEKLKQNIPGRYIVIAIGGKFATKRLPKEKIVRLCKGLAQHIVLIGGKNEKETAAYIRQEVNKNISDTCGQLSLNQSALLIKNAALLITHDTGMMHIGAALGKDIIVIWGNTTPLFGMYPYTKGRPMQQIKMFEIDKLSCRPCSKLGFQACPKKHFLCMQAHKEKDIINTANTILTSK